MIPTAHPDALDLMRKLFVFNPNSRLSASEALKHPYLKQFHKQHEKQEVELTEPISMYFFYRKSFASMTTKSSPSENTGKSYTKILPKRKRNKRKDGSKKYWQSWGLKSTVISRWFLKNSITMCKTSFSTRIRAKFIRNSLRKSISRSWASVNTKKNTWSPNPEWTEAVNRMNCLS